MDPDGDAALANVSVEQDDERMEISTPAGALMIVDSTRPEPAATALILPPRIANLITTLASSTRLTLSIVAFFTETILETWQFSTRASLGYTRQYLISAITIARRNYLLSAPRSELEDDTRNEGGFLSVLDRYTNLGIYLIHHTFTLAELFTMSGFYLAGTVFSSAHSAATESVMVLDTIFGSNESSRVLASVIGLVKRELFVDERWNELIVRKGKGRGKGKGTMKTLAGLTKAMTAFACLQNATWGRTSQRLRMRL